MGLGSSLLIGQSALAASQLALQVTGNNIANVGTTGYSRQTVGLRPVGGERETSRIFLGRGVSVSDVRRSIDPALLSRMRNGISDEQSASVDRSILSQIESVLGELGDADLSNQLTKFFRAFSELANNPSSSVNRASVVEEGASLAAFFRGQRSDLTNARIQLERQLESEVNRGEELLQQIADLNLAVVSAELGGGSDGSLRDQRDTLLNELASLMDITVIEQESGAVDVLVGSAPVVLGTTSRGLQYDVRTVGDEVEIRVLVRESQESLNISSGSIGSRMAQRDKAVVDVIEKLDTLASNVIFEVNKLHTSGKALKHFTDITGWQNVAPADQALAFNDPTNETFADLPFRPVNGSFRVVITDADGNQSVTTVNVDLDGITAAGAPGTADDTSLDDLVAALDAVPNLNASITPEGRLRLTTDAGYDVSFQDDTSGALAVLGINTYFQGVDAADIAVTASLRADPQGLIVGLTPGSNETALAIAGLRDRGLATLGGDTLSQSWLKTVEGNGVQVRSAETRLDAVATVRQSLEAQHSAVSGVSLDEESLNLITYQQAYQGAARFVGVVNDLTQILLNLV